MEADWLGELKQRHATLGDIIKKHDLDAILLVGNNNVGPPAYGSLRYYSGYRVYAGLQALIAVPGKSLTAVCESRPDEYALKTRGFERVITSPDILSGVLSVLAEQPVRRLGLCPDILPSSLFLELEKRDVIFTDVTDDIFTVRNERSEPEVAAIRECAKIADAGYQAVCDMAGPGVRMSDLHAELDYTMKKAGAEETFTLMSNGRFSYENNRLSFLRAFTWPDDRVIKEGDNIAMEITPKYQGHWTQTVRMICIGEPHADLRIAHKAQLETIESTVPLLRTGNRLADVLTHMVEYGAGLGYINKFPFGHIMGLDLDEGGRASLETNVILKRNMTFVLHPTLTTADKEYGIFWGDPYLVTDNGGERLTKGSTELRVL